EERGTGTLEVLLTAPIRDWQVAYAKFIACFAFYLLLWVTTLVYVPVLADLHAQWELGITPFSVALLVGIALVVLAKVGFWFEAPPFFVLLPGLLGIALAAAGGYLHYTRDAEQLVRVTANIDPRPVLTSYLGIVLAGAMFLSLGL